LRIKRGLIWRPELCFNFSKSSFDLRKSVSRLARRHHLRRVINRLVDLGRSVLSGVVDEVVDVQSGIGLGVVSDLLGDTFTNGLNPSPSQLNPTGGKHGGGSSHTLAEHFQEHVGVVSLLTHCLLGQSFTDTGCSDLDSTGSNRTSWHVEPGTGCIGRCFGGLCHLRGGHGCANSRVVGKIDTAAGQHLSSRLDGCALGSGEERTSALEAESFNGADDGTTGQARRQTFAGDVWILVKCGGDLLPRHSSRVTDAFNKPLVDLAASLQCGVGRSASRDATGDAGCNSARSGSGQADKTAGSRTNKASTEGDRRGDKRVGEGLDSRLEGGTRLTKCSHRQVNRLAECGEEPTGLLEFFGLLVEVFKERHVFRRLSLLQGALGLSLLLQAGSHVGGVTSQGVERRASTAKSLPAALVERGAELREVAGGFFWCSGGCKLGANACNFCVNLIRCQVNRAIKFNCLAVNVNLVEGHGLL
jgi:hypothetical protein